MNRIKRKCWYIITQYYYKLKFKSIGKHSVLNKPLQLDNVNSICIGKEVYIGEGAWLMGSNKSVTTAWINDSTTIGHFSHIVAVHSVTIGKSVLIADRVFISDCSHRYEDVSIPIIKQDIKKLAPVSIGEGSWIGENVCVCGASVGKHCVVGANSVVTVDIPDYSVAVGSPAKVVKRYDFEMQEWVRV